MAKNMKTTVSGSLTDKERKEIGTYLKKLRGELKKSLHELDRYGQGAFAASPIVLDFSEAEIKSQIRINIRRRRNKKGDLVTRGSKVTDEQKAKELTLKFSKWFKEALTQGIKNSKAKRVSTLEELRDEAESHAYKTGKGKLPRKYIFDKAYSRGPIYHRTGDTIWFYDSSRSDQKDAFRESILKKARAYSESKKNSQKNDPDYAAFNKWFFKVHLGHTFGLKASQLAGVFDTSGKGSIARSVKSKDGPKLKNIEAVGNVDFVKGITQNLVSKLEIDMNFDVEKKITPGKDGLIQGLTLEFGPDNSASGSKLRGQLNNFAKTKIEEALEALKKNITAAEVLNILSSPTTKEIILENIIAVFTGKKPKPYKSKKRTTDKITKSKKSKVTTQKFKVASKILVELGEDALDLNSKIPYLNRKLHDKIQQNMGKGRAKQILNYQTGRFAKSAEIENFTPSREKRAVNAKVKYMRYPYGTFEKGGKLHKPGRNPERIFARSIRQLLQEEKIITLRRVKVKLSG